MSKAKIGVPNSASTFSAQCRTWELVFYKYVQQRLIANAKIIILTSSKAVERRENGQNE